MKTITLLLLAAYAVTASTFAQTDAMTSNDAKPISGMAMKQKTDMKGMDMASLKDGKPAGHAEIHVADGTVKAVDPTGKVTLQHGAVKSLGWPAMTMGFAVKDKALMDKLAVGNKVHVEFVKQGGDYVIKSVK